MLSQLHTPPFFTARLSNVNVTSPCPRSSKCTSFLTIIHYAFLVSTILAPYPLHCSPLHFAIITSNTRRVAGRQPSNFHVTEQGDSDGYAFACIRQKRGSNLGRGHRISRLKVPVNFPNSSWKIPG
jgi:hypothetical protein